MLLAALMISIFNASGKSNLNANVLVACRFCLPCIVIFLIMRFNIWTLISNISFMVFVRAFFTIINQYTFFMAIAHLPLVTITTLMNTAPIFLVLFGFLVNPRSMPKRMIGWVVIGFVGVVLIMNQQAFYYNSYVLLALVSSCCWAASNLCQSQLVRQYSNTICMAYYYLTGSIVSLVVLFFYSSSRVLMNIAQHWGAIVIVSIATLLFQYLTGKAYKIKSSTYLSSYLYFAVLFAAVIGMVYFHEFPTIKFAIGAFFIILSALLLSWSSHKIFK